MSHPAIAGSHDSGKKSCPAGCVDARVANRLIAAAADLALVIDEKDQVLEVTLGESVQPHAGWNRLVGQRWADTVAPDSRVKAEQLIEEARAGEVTRSREVNQHTEGMGQLPFRFSAVLLDDKKRVVVLGRDLRAMAALQQQMVSAQLAMDREYGRLRQAETRYRLLFQVSSEGVLVAEAASLKVVEANPAAATLFEDSVQALRGKSLQELVEARSWPTLQALLAAIEAGGRPSDVQIQIPGKPGTLDVSANLFRQSGTALLLLRLRTAGGAATAAGSTRSSRILAVLDALPEGFVVIGEDRRILSANAAFCDMAHQGNENQVVGQPLDRWLGRPGVDLNIILANLREHGAVRNFATIVRGDYGAPQEAVVSAVSALDARVPCVGFSIRTVPARLTVVPPTGLPTPRSVDQLRELVGRAPLKDIVRESADLIERLCIEAALKVSGNNRASAAQLLGLSRQGLYSKLRRYGLGDLDGDA